MTVMDNFDLYLASASPRRKQLLESLGLKVFICPTGIDESPLFEEQAEDYVCRLALQKSQAAFARQLDLGLLVNDLGQEQFTQNNKSVWGNKKPFLGADTIVVCEGKLFGKPKNKDHAKTMWQAMSGKEHQVLTAVAVIDGLDDSAKQIIELSVSQVQFKVIDESEMEIYWQTGEPQDKAGAYGIQGFASAWVESIQGSYSGIMGLPLFEVNRALRSFVLNWL